MTQTTPEQSGAARWQSRFDAAQAKGQVRDADFTTLSGMEVEPAYGPADGSEVPERIGWPGEFPFTRGLHASGYRGRAWTIRQFAGFGNAAQTNERYRTILANGGGGLSVAFDMPTLMGRDSDDPRSLGEVGRRHQVNRALMKQELAFLEHLTRLLGSEEESGYSRPGEGETLSPRAAAHRVLDLQA